MSDALHWDNRYRSGDIPWNTGRHSSELERVITEEQIQPCRAIELGCGIGTNAIWLASKGFEVTALDLSPLAIAHAQEQAESQGVRVRFMATDVLGTGDLGDPYTFFFDRGCYHIVRRENVQAYVATLRKITQPGSLGLVLAGNAREPHHPGPPVVAENEIRQELGRFFDILWLREIRFDQVEEGGKQFLGWSCFLTRSEAS